MWGSVRFVVEILDSGRLRARSLEADLLVEADTLVDLEAQAREAVMRTLGATHGADLLLGFYGRNTTRPGTTKSAAG